MLSGDDVRAVRHRYPRHSPFEPRTSARASSALTWVQRCGAGASDGELDTEAASACPALEAQPRRLGRKRSRLVLDELVAALDATSVARAVRADHCCPEMRQGPARNFFRPGLSLSQHSVRPKGLEPLTF